MQRYLVVTAHANRYDTMTLEGQVESIKRVLEAYLYNSAELVAFASDCGPKEITAKALITVSTDDGPERLRYLADYQADRIRSGLFGVQDYVEDEQAARREVLGADWATAEPKPLTPALALAYAIDALDREEVRYSLALDEDHLDSFTTTLDQTTGEERPYTEADLNDDIKHHDAVIDLLRQLYAVVKDIPVVEDIGCPRGPGGDHSVNSSGVCVYCDAQVDVDLDAEA